MVSESAAGCIRRPMGLLLGQAFGFGLKFWLGIALIGGINLVAMMQGADSERAR